MNIGKIAKAADLPVKTVRYYDEIGLVTPAGRSVAGYREYDERNLRNLIFVRRARDFGFSIDQCRELLSLYDNESRTSAEVKRIARARLAEIDAKMSELERLRDELEHLVAHCKGDDRPDCPILDGLASAPLNEQAN